MRLGASFIFRGGTRRVPARHYANAVLFSLIAFAAQYLLRDWLAPAPHYLVFYFSVIAASAIGGMGPGVLATLLGLLLAIPSTLRGDGYVWSTPKILDRSFGMCLSLSLYCSFVRA